VPDELRSRVMAVYATDVHGVAADWGVDRGWDGETYPRAEYAGGVWSLVLVGSVIFIFRVVMKLGETQNSDGRLSRIRAVEPGGFCEELSERRCVHSRENGVDFGTQRRERADGVGGGGVSSEEQCLAPTAAEVLLAAVAGFARLLHPIFSTEFLECGGVLQISRRLRSLRFSNERPGMTCAAWQGSASPLGVISISLRPQPPYRALDILHSNRGPRIQANPALKPLLFTLDEGERLIQLFARGQ